MSPEMSAEMSAGRSAEKTVLVTGGSGYIGSWVIIQLLQKGYAVRTTVRNLAREPQVRAAIAKVVDPGPRLSFHAADLLSDRGWPAAADGTDAALFSADARFMAPLLGQRREFNPGKAARLLGWHPRTVSEAVVATAESLLAQGLV